MELTRSAPFQLAANLPDIVPNVAECMYDAKQQVKVRYCSTSQHTRQLLMMLPCGIRCM